MTFTEFEQRAIEAGLQPYFHHKGHYLARRGDGVTLSYLRKKRRAVVSMGPYTVLEFKSANDLMAQVVGLPRLDKLVRSKGMWQRRDERP